ncbi:hypothetical protein ACVST0_21015 [Yersinia enterocolitica]
MSTVKREILPQHHFFYIQSMLFNTKSAINSLELVGEFIKSLHLGPQSTTKEKMSSILDELQNIVINAAALSKYFWPVRKQHNWRGDALKLVFDIQENSVLESRVIRDKIEHFDERLDKYLENNVVGAIIPEFIGVSDDDLDSAYGSTHIFRAFFIDIEAFSILGENYDIKPIAEEIRRIHKKLEYFENNGCRFQIN